MKRIIDWYWEHGVNRPMEWTFSTASFNAIMGIANRHAAISQIRKTDNKKACVAFWGPSQSGKSSLLSHYIDGNSDDDLALMWNPSQKVRFSAYQVNDASDTNCVVFNPFHGGMDASGLVTRFYLPSEDEAKKISPEAPVEVILANRKQVLQSIAVGYRMECQESVNPWGLDQLREKINRPGSRPNRKAFELLFDVCDVCENMAHEISRYREFLNGPKLRQQILSSSYVEHMDDALQLAAYLLWDGEPKLTDLYNNLMASYRELNELRNNDTPNRIFVSMEIAALLEDIGILSFYEQNKIHPSSAEAKRRVDALNHLRMYVTSRGLFYTSDKEPLSDKTNSYSLEIKDFGYLQALIGELRIPLRKSEKSTAKPFFDFLKKCDLLDIPGVTNKASGEALGPANQIDLGSDNGASESLLLSRMYKAGKTLSIVYSQAETCSIDSFVIFVDLERAGGISRPTTITNGVKAWLSAYGVKSFNARPPLKLYLNCSLFGKLMNLVVAAINGGGLANYCEKAAALGLTSSHLTDCFFTTNCFATCTDKSKKHYFEDDPVFKNAFLWGHGQESLGALFDDGLGADYMFNRLCADVESTERMSLYEQVEMRDRTKLKLELERILPFDQVGAAALRKDVVKKVFARVTQQIAEDKPDLVRKLVSFIKKVFVVEEQLLDPIPRTPHMMHADELRKYILQQIRKWISTRKDELAGATGFDWLVAEAETYPFLEALATIDVDRIVNLLKKDFWNHSPKVSRTFLAMILNNCLLCGDYERRRCERSTGEYGMLCAPFVARLETLSTATYTNAGGRPVDLDGDAELFKIVQELKLA